MATDTTTPPLSTTADNTPEGPLSCFFRLREHGTSLRTEALGGLTTFATMAYIIVVNPAILQSAGLPVGPSTVATILTAAFGSILMGLYANRPFAVARIWAKTPSSPLGLAAMGIGWELRLGTVFVAGLLFLAITLLKIRGWLADSISEPQTQLRRRHRPLPGVHRPLPDRHRDELPRRDAHPSSARSSPAPTSR